jgi:hypothetical protein
VMSAIGVAASIANAFMLGWLLVTGPWRLP